LYTRGARYCEGASVPRRTAITSHGRRNRTAGRTAADGGRGDRRRRDGEAGMTGNVIETVMGAVVLVVAALFLFFAYSMSQVRTVQGYSVTAQFQAVDGIRDGGDVRIAGVKVGTVLSETLDPKTYLATVRMSINPDYKLPDDTVAEIVSAGLLGDRYMAL